MKNTEIEINKIYSYAIDGRDTVVEVIESTGSAVASHLTSDLYADAPSISPFDYLYQIKICDGPHTGETRTVKSGGLKPLTQNKEE